MTRPNSELTALGAGPKLLWQVLSAATLLLFLLALLGYYIPLLPQLLADGMLSGGIYVVLSLGLSLSFGILKILNLAHGEFMILGAFVSYWLFTWTGLDPFLTIPFAFLIPFGVGMLVQAKLLNPAIFAGAGIGQLLVICFGLMLILRNGFILAWSADPRAIIPSYFGTTLEVMGTTISVVRLGTLTIAAFMVFLLDLLLKKTLTGTAIRALAQDWEAAAYLGVPVRRLYAITFGLSAGYGGAGGSLISISSAFEPTAGITFLLRALAIIVLAGTGSIQGLFLAGMLVGMIEVLTSYLIGPSFGSLTTFILLLLLLLIRPTGLFGGKLRGK